jgi:putative flippase GtrA
MKLFKYFFVGGVAALVDISIFALFAKILQFNYLLIGAFGFILATFVNYILSVRYVFSSGIRFNNKQQELIAVYMVSAMGLLIHQVALYSAVNLLNLELMLAKINATGIVFLWNFSIRHFFVFSAKKIS